MIDTGSVISIYVLSYRCLKAEEEVIQWEVDSMLEMGVIRYSKSFWSASLILVIKKTDDWRFCMDFRVLNRVIKREFYFMLLVDEMFNSVG